MKRKYSRREWLKLFLAGVPAACFGLGGLGNALIPTKAAGTRTPVVYLPYVNRPVEPTATPTPLPSKTPDSSPTGSAPKVIHIFGASATNWDFSSGYFYDHVNQATVNAMVDQGLRTLTGKSTADAAWSSLLTGYKAGDKIAIKVNFNNTQNNAYVGNTIDGLMEPVNALLSGLVAMGVPQGNITVCDPSRTLPQKFLDKALYKSVHYVGDGQSAFSSRAINFGLSGVTNRILCDTLVNAQHLINMPIVKQHGITGATLGFKNHFGSIDQVEKGGNDSLHIHASPDDTNFSASKTPQVTIFSDANISGKTRLTVGDGLFGALGNTNVTPERWITFGSGSPRSLFFAIDPVAIDCVMMDILAAERAFYTYDHGTVDDYLKLASQKGFGVYERKANLSYTNIAYQRADIA